METTPYAFGKTVDMSFADAERKVRELLAAEGFGIISEIDVRQKFVERLGREFRNYRILGACNPALAFEVLSMAAAAGTLLPCNVVIYDADEDGGTTIMVMDPLPVLGLVDDEKVLEHARKAEQKMRRVVDAL
ncbi:MAG: DUF302 domain-containing protein [Chlorobiaceae bacterium]|nr:DUF302 domain-containing protein [Chlorobiaceae bacterium]